MTLQAILWDVDGTLIDSEVVHYACLIDYCGFNAIPFTLSLNDVRGKNLSDIWDQGNISNYFNDKERWIREVMQAYIDVVSPNLICKGVYTLLEDFKRRGYHQACVSNGETDIVSANLMKTGLHSHMKFWLSCEDVAFPKPHPEPYLQACRLLNILPLEAIAIEDSHVGIKSAIAAGAFTIAVTDSLNLTKNEISPHFWVKDIATLAEKLNMVLARYCSWSTGVKPKRG